jgi:anti-sigma B factor antagonist
MKQEEVNGIRIVTLSERNVDAVNAAGVKERLLALLQPGQRVIIDITSLEFVDSSGLGVLLSALRLVSADGGDLKLAGATKSLRAILELVRFHRVLDILNTREEALRAFAAH